MNGMVSMWNALLEKVGEGVVYDAAASYGYDISYVESPELEVPTDVSVELFIELITFVMEALEPINYAKVHEWLDEYDISEEDVEEYMS